MKGDFQRYVEYLKDNPKEYWFRRKLYGWGWTPVRWQGWAVVLVFVVLLIWSGFSISDSSEITEQQLTWFFVRLVVLVGTLFFICFKKGEKPRWQWGIPKKEEEGNDE